MCMEVERMLSPEQASGIEAAMFCEPYLVEDWVNLFRRELILVRG